MPDEKVDPPEPPVIGPQEPKQREWVRAALAGTAIVIFAAEVVFSVCFLAHTAPQDLNGAITAIKEFALIFLGPTVALVGATTGFYFGRS